MGRCDRAKNYLRRLTGVVVGFLAVLLALPMATATDYIPRGQPIPQNIRVVGTTSTGVNASMTAMYLNATGNTTYHKVPVPVSSSTLGKLGKTALKRLGPAAALYQTIKGILDGIGWFIDEATRQVMSPGTPGTPLGQTIYCIGNNCASGPGMLSSVAHVAVGLAQPCSPNGNYGADGGARYGCTNLDGSWRQNAASEVRRTRAANASWPVEYVNVGAGTPPAEIPDNDLGNALKTVPNVINAIMIDPETGAPIRTQEVTDALNNLRRALEAANGTTTPAPDLGTDTGWEEGQETPSETEWPGFCDWATTVCDAIDWFRSPDDEYEKPEVPWEEMPVEQQEWSSGIGGGSCPAPVTFTVSVSGVSVSPRFEMQPVCDFATMMRPLVIAIATLVGVYIVAGLRQNKDA